MEPPPAAAAVAAAAAMPPAITTVASTAATTTTAATYPDSIDSSPRSRATDFGDPFPPVGGGKLRLMCSYGGHIVPRPHDKALCYAAGDTRMVVVDRSSTLSDLMSRLSKILLNGRRFTLKYQLPNEDLDSLITVSTEEDLDNMIDEYDRLMANTNSTKPSRIRLFLFPSKPEGASSIGSILEGSNMSDDWFLNALNGSAAALHRGFSDPASVNSLLGLEENGCNFGNIESSESKETDVVVGQCEEKLGNQNRSNPDIHSVPDSPIIGTTSSFGSTSSSPSLANLPPIRVHAEDGGAGGGGARVFDHRIGIEEQFAQMGASVQKHDEGFVVISSPPTLPPNMAPQAVVTGVPAMVAGVEFPNRVFSDDERSDHGVPVGYRKQPQPVGQPDMTSQAQQKQMGGELASPDSVSSDSSLSNVISRQKPAIYHDPVGQLSSGSSRLPPNLVDPNTRVHVQQVSESGYAPPTHYDQHQQQLLQQQHQHQHQHQHQKQHQHQQAQTQPQAQQYIPAGPHFVHHHHHPAGAVPLSTYYPMYPPHQPHHHPHQYPGPVYYMPAGQAQTYTLPLQQQLNLGEAASSVSSSRPQTTPPNPTIITTSSAYNPTRNVPPPKPEMTAAVYRTTTAAGPQLVQVASGQHQPQSQAQAQAQAQQQQQFAGYSQTQIHHPSQSMAPLNSAATAGYTYEFADPAHAQVYYTQALAPSVPAQYQAVTSGPGVVLPDGSSQVQNDNLKQHIRSSQPL